MISQFKEFVIQHYDCSIGKRKTFCDYIKNDEHFTTRQSKAKIMNYLHSKGASNEVLNGFKECFREYRDYVLQCIQEEVKEENKKWEEERNKI